MHWAFSTLIVVVVVAFVVAMWPTTPKLQHGSTLQPHPSVTTSIAHHGTMQSSITPSAVMGGSPVSHATVINTRAA